MLTIIAIICAYLLGSISCSVLVCQLADQPDPRTQGSRNPGTTNVLRLAGKKFALLTLAGDIIKGTIAVVLGRILHQEGLTLGCVALAASLGHMYPLLLNFKGGKGVATGFGVMIALSPLLSLIVISTWGIIAATFRYSSLAALVTFALAPFYALFLTNPAYFVPLLLMTGLITWRHKENIKRLRYGIENKIGEH